MKRLLPLLVAALAFAGLTEAAAQSRTSYFMEGSYFRTELNPALVPTRGYLALPLISGFGYNDSSNYNSLENNYFYKDDKYVSGLDDRVSAGEYLAGFPDVCRRDLSETYNLLGVGFYAKRTFWNFGVNGRITGQTTTPKSMLGYLKSPDGTLFEEGTQGYGSAFLDVYLGTSFPVTRWMNVGVRAKFLVGILDIGLEVESLMTSPESNDLVDALRGRWRINTGILDNRNVTPEGEYVDNDEHDGSLGDLLRNVNSYGGAIDLGAEARLLDNHLKLSLAVTDLGFIRWHPTSHLCGELVESETGSINESTTKEIISVPEKPGYTTTLNCSLNVGAEYSILNNHIGFGVLSHTKFGKSMTYTELTASINFRPTNWLSATVSHTFFNGNRPGIFGAALNIHPAVINIFLGVDFIDTKYVLNYDLPPLSDSDVMAYPPMPVAKSATSVNVYAGVGINFGRPKHLKSDRRKE